MKLEEKLQLLRRQHGYSQEQLAETLGIARQTVSKWETGQSIPELSGLIALSRLYSVTIDRIVCEDDKCSTPLQPLETVSRAQLAQFLLRAKQGCYAGGGRETAPCRTASHDYCYREGDYEYYDTYLGGEEFAGQEAAWYNGAPVWSMNYIGRVLGENFSGDFLKQALYRAPADMPIRGPQVYSKGEYAYHCTIEGGFDWYCGFEEIFCSGIKVYECRFHGGRLC